MSRFKMLYEENVEGELFRISPFMTHRTKRGDFIDGTVYQDVELDYSLKNDNWKILYDYIDELKLKIDARLLREDGKRPKQTEKVWNVWNKVNKLLLSKSTYKECLNFAKMHIKEIVIKVGIISS